VADPLRVPLHSIAPGAVVLDSDTARYVTRVHRLGVGDSFIAFDPEARLEADAHITSVNRSVRCDLERVRPATAVAKTGVTLVQALGKGDKPERVVRDATALGVERIVFCVSSRTVARPGERTPSRLARFRAVAVEACRQSGRGDAPLVEGPVPLSEALASDGSTAAVRLCLDTRATTSLAAALGEWRPDRPLTVLVGPEGGFDETEIRAATDAGFVLVRLGDFVLRTETAAVAVLGALVAQIRREL
jgi:16S rRNA (uracil1498-N3)-methyltransferase